jgi:hypothetical protein
MSETQIERAGGLVRGSFSRETAYSSLEQQKLQPTETTDFCRVVDGELFRIAMMPSISERQARFINEVVVATSNIIHDELNDELNNYNLELPDISSLRTGAGMLPRLVRKLQEIRNSRGLREICTYSNGMLLNDKDTWLKVTNEIAKGKVNIYADDYEARNKRVYREPLEDFASGMVHFIKLLSDENDGLPIDELLSTQRSNMRNSYESLYLPGAFDARQQELLERTAHAAHIGEAVINGFLVPSQVK